MKIKEIVIESETKDAIIGGHKESNDNSDIEVILEDARIFYATAFTFENIEWLRNKNLKTGECLSGGYFWAKNMLLVNRINKNEIEQVIEHLIRENEFESVFKRIDSFRSVWVFNAPSKTFSGGVFTDIDEAEKWIAKHKLTGVLTKYPLNKGALDLAIENNAIDMKPEKLSEKIKNPSFIGGFTKLLWNITTMKMAHEIKNYLVYPSL